MKRPPTKIGDESTVPGMPIDTRARVVAFDAVIPVAALDRLARSAVTPNIGQALPGCSGGVVVTGAGSVVAVAVPVLLSVLPPLEQAAASAEIESRMDTRPLTARRCTSP